MKKSVLRIAIKLPKYVGIFLSSLIILYFVSSVIFSLIPVNRTAEKEEFENIYLLSNGVHAGIVLPIANEYIDWKEYVFISESIVERVQYIGFGWGDKAFYLKHSGVV